MRQRQAGASSITLAARCNDSRHVDPSQRHAKTNSLIETTRSLSRRNPCHCCCERPGHQRPRRQPDPYVQNIPPPGLGRQGKTTISTARGTCQVLALARPCPTRDCAVGAGRCGHYNWIDDGQGAPATSRRHAGSCFTPTAPTAAAPRGQDWRLGRTAAPRAWRPAPGDRGGLASARWPSDG